MADPEPIPVCRPFVPPTAIDDLQHCLASGWLGYGPRCHALEQRFSARGGASLATSNCTSALLLAAHLCSSEERNEILVPAVTFVSSAMAFHYAGMRVRLVDVDESTGLIDPAEVERLATPQTCAVLAVHLFGQRAPMQELRALCDRLDMTLIEDCAHRIDLLDDAMLVGDMACYSFNAVKEAPGGEGGLLWCRDTALIDRARAISNLGMQVDTPTRANSLVHHEYQFSGELGLKCRGFDMPSALVLAGLDWLPKTRARRQEIFAAYDAAIAGGEIFVPMLRQADDSYLMYVARAAKHRRAEVRARLAKAGIATATHYTSLSRHQVFREDVLLRAETLDRQVLTLPCYPDMRDDQVDRVVRALSSLCDDAGLVNAA